MSKALPRLINIADVPILISKPRQQEEKLHLQSVIAENLPEGIIITRSDDQKILYVNPKIERLFGYDHGELNGLHLSVLNSAGGLSANQKFNEIKQTILKNEPWNGEIHCIKKDGALLGCNVSISGFDHHYYGKVWLAIYSDITTRKAMEENLRKTNEELKLLIEEKTNELQRKNIALTEVLSQLEIEKRNLASKVDVNVQKLLLPVIEKLIEKSSSFDGRYLMMIKQNLEELTSSFGIKLSSVKFHLTPKEIELCTLIKGGFSIKEIATMQNLSQRTVETHRFNIRKKLGILSSKTNLASYLAEL